MGLLFHTKRKTHSTQCLYWEVFFLSVLPLTNGWINDKGHNTPVSKTRSLYHPSPLSAQASSLASSQALPALKVAIDDECSGKGLVFTKNNQPADWLITWGFPNSWGFPQVSAASRAYTVHRRNFAFRKQRLFRFRSSNGWKEAACRPCHRRSPKCGVWKTSMLFKDHTRMTMHDTLRSVLSGTLWAKVPSCLISLFIFFGLMCDFFFLKSAWWSCKLRTIRRNLWPADSKNTAKTGYRGRFRKREHRPCLQHALVIRWTEIKTRYLRGFELSISNTESETKACSWAETQVAVGLWVGMHGCFNLSTNQKARELCKNNTVKEKIFVGNLIS